MSTQHCIAMFDIDRFKQVNDTDGHIMGDRVIQGIGEILRGGSFAGAQAVARHGCEAFVTLLPETPVGKGAMVAQTVSNRVKAMKIRNRDAGDRPERDYFGRRGCAPAW